MNQPLIVLLSEGAVAVFMAIAFLLLVLASVYDMTLIARRSPREPSKKLASHVTILLYCDTAERTIETCLQRIAKSNYADYDVVAINNVSADGTKRVFKKYQAEQDATNARFYNKRKKTSKYQALRDGYRRSKKGELVLVLDANDAVPITFTSLAMEFRKLAVVLRQKSLAVLHMTRNTVDMPSMWYERVTFKKPPSTPRRSMKVVNVGVVMCALFFMTYFIVIAAWLESSQMLTLSWLAVTVGCFIMVWADDIAMKKKFALFVVAPLVYFFGYVQLILWLFGFMREFSHTARRLSVYS